MNTARDEPMLIQHAQAGDADAFGRLGLHQDFVYDLPKLKTWRRKPSCGLG